VTDLLIAHASHTPPAPSSLGIDVPDALEQMVMSMLAKEPADRPSTMGEVSSMLRAMVDWLPPPVQPFQVQAPSMSEVQSRTAILPVAVSPMMYGTNVPSRPAPTPLPPHTTLEQSTGTLDTPERLRRPSRRGWMIGAVATVAVLGVGAYLYSDELIDRSAHSQRRPGSDEMENDTPSTPPKPFDLPGGTGSGRGEGLLPATITVEVEGAPEGLQVTVDGDGGSLPVRLPRDGAVHKLVFRAPGFQPETRIIEASKSQIVSLSLKPAKETPPKDEVKEQRLAPPVRTPLPPRSYRRRLPPPATRPASRGSEVIIDI
jgi:hypothetical protein